jgi:hypothetical protein
MNIELCTTFEAFINESFDKNRRVFSADTEKGILKNVKINKTIKPDSIIKSKPKYSYRVNRNINIDKLPPTPTTP